MDHWDKGMKGSVRKGNGVANWIEFSAYWIRATDCLIKQI